jgi:hypothetical protein
MLNRALPEAHRDQLPVRHDSLLTAGEIPHGSLTWALVLSYIDV